MLGPSSEGTHPHTHKVLKKEGGIIDLHGQHHWADAAGLCVLCFLPPFFSSGYSNLSVERFKVQRAKKTTARIRWNFPSITIPPSVRPSTARLIKAHNFFFPSTQMSSNPFFFILSFFFTCWDTLESPSVEKPIKTTTTTTQTCVWLPLLVLDSQRKEKKLELGFHSVPFMYIYI